MLKTSRLLLMAVLFVFALITQVHAGDFQGEWFGHWRNSLGEGGADSLSLHYTHHGDVRGTWSGDVRVWGEQTGEHSLHLNGERNNGVTYDIRAHRGHGEIHLHYTATRLNGSTYEGWSELHRRY